VSAAKPRIRPPFTTLVTRLIPIIFSRKAVAAIVLLLLSSALPLLGHGSLCLRT
jgi:hypothetical protein